MANISEVFDPEKLAVHLERGMISKRKHPSLPIYIYNYTNECTFSDTWDEVTRACRGLILDENGEIIARPFMKFFNFNTASQSDTLLENLPKTAPNVTEKLDGSLGIFWRYKGHYGVATRGSFESEQAIWATQYAHQASELFEVFPEGVTPLFEIIYPENRIVVDYKGKKELTLLSIVRNSSGMEYSYNDLRLTGYPFIVRSYPGMSLTDCAFQSSIDVPVNAEGYVLLYDISPMSPPLRIKIKFVDYVRTHKFMFTLNDRVVWDMMRRGIDPLKEMDRIPEDAKIWVSGVCSRMRGLFEGMEMIAKYVYDTRPPSGTRKDIALHFCEYPNIQSACFSMLDNKDYKEVLWKKIEPQKATMFRRISIDAE